MTAKRRRDPSEDVVHRELEGNLCCCTGYHNIVKAIAAGAKAHGRLTAPAQGDSPHVFVYV